MATMILKTNLPFSKCVYTVQRYRGEVENIHTYEIRYVEC